jgi:hypothetical protein
MRIMLVLTKKMHETQATSDRITIWIGMGNNDHLFWSFQ